MNVNSLPKVAGFYVSQISILKLWVLARYNRPYFSSKFLPLNASETARS